MDQYCTHCGTKLPAGARFCRNCGQSAAATQPATATETPPPPYAAATSAAAQSAATAAPAYQPYGSAAAPPYAAPAPQPPAGNSYASRQPLVGWTERHLDPVVLARAAKHKKSAWIFTLILTVLFPVGFALAGALMDDMPLNEALIIGIGLGLMMLIIGLVRISRMKTGTWDGTVIDKKQKRKMNNTPEDHPVSYRTIYTLVVAEDNGKKHKLNYTDNTALYNYFNVGDRIRCHMAFATYEKYDKSRDSMIFCNICGTINDIGNDLCRSCHLPLFK